ncbi:VOC family protein [Candidatus Nitrosocosmicus franklandus]|uniref:Glyoxalase-like domain protein n=1 Tax=Candidatus Nitrosocosmicus franklandianus TaxID=1798806 RepID=A0A484IH20_9ARCH|nr:VOC family protein [Candidatus Nitrosocosmicus franklandus]VFJ14954.1 Glyoxalase-like domain protein [Candidatus Nitrosocosmicus franklandus]
MNNVIMISAVTLAIKNMKKSCSFYTSIPGFQIIYGGSSNDSFTSYQIGKDNKVTFLNLELKKFSDANKLYENHRTNFGRIIFYTDSVDNLYAYFSTNKFISNLILIEFEPINAPWKERYFHIRDPDGYQLSFAQPI